jgi:hypothetical protein
VKYATNYEPLVTVRNILPLSVTFSLLGQSKGLSSQYFSRTLNLPFFLCVQDQDSKPETKLQRANINLYVSGYESRYKISD